MTKARREALRAQLAGDWAYFTDYESIFYLSNFSGSNAVLVIGDKEESDLLITDARYQERVKSIENEIKVVIAHDFKAILKEQIPTSVQLRIDGKRVSAYQASELVSALPDREIISAVDFLLNLRIKKDEAEIAQLKKACEITSQSLWYLINDLRPGMTEKQIAKKFWQNALDRGADALAFDTIVASGENSASPHHEPMGRVLQKGDLVTIDCGVSFNGYQSDMTRTVFIGKTEAWQVEIYQSVMQAQAEAIAKAQIGIVAQEVDATAREVITNAGFGDYFVHGTGHGVGIEVHEAPFITSGNQTELNENFCFTVEPGIYLPGRGGVRIEDTCILTKGGLEILTKGSHEIICVG
ncbi:MAG: M24 family metallopeptidase [Candidatus Nanopelagicales bacterium]